MSDNLPNAVIGAARDPRDLFDVGLLLEDERADQVLWRTFLIYPTCSPKPAREMLAPRVPADFAATFEAHCKGMTAEPIEPEVLLDIHERLLARVAGWRNRRARSYDPLRISSRIST